MDRKQIKYEINVAARRVPSPWSSSFCHTCCACVTVSNCNDRGTQGLFRYKLARHGTESVVAASRSINTVYRDCWPPWKEGQSLVLHLPTYLNTNHIPRFHYVTPELQYPWHKLSPFSTGILGMLLSWCSHISLSTWTSWESNIYTPKVSVQCEFEVEYLSRLCFSPFKICIVSLLFWVGQFWYSHSSELKGTIKIVISARMFT
jgi:hypothetical protein